MQSLSNISKDSSSYRERTLRTEDSYSNGGSGATTQRNYVNSSIYGLNQMIPMQQYFKPSDHSRLVPLQQQQHGYLQSPSIPYGQQAIHYPPQTPTSSQPSADYFLHSSISHLSTEISSINEKLRKITGSGRVDIKNQLLQPQQQQQSVERKISPIKTRIKRTISSSSASSSSNSSRSRVGSISGSSSKSSDSSRERRLKKRLIKKEKLKSQTSLQSLSQMMHEYVELVKSDIWDRNAFRETFVSEKSFFKLREGRKYKTLFKRILAVVLACMQRHRQNVKLLEVQSHSQAVLPILQGQLVTPRSPTYIAAPQQTPIINFKESFVSNVSENMNYIVQTQKYQQNQQLFQQQQQQQSQYYQQLYDQNMLMHQGQDIVNNKQYQMQQHCLTERSNREEVSRNQFNFETEMERRRKSVEEMRLFHESEQQTGIINTQNMTQQSRVDRNKVHNHTNVVEYPSEANNNTVSYKYKQQRPAVTLIAAEQSLSEIANQSIPITPTQLLGVSHDQKSEAGASSVYKATRFEDSANGVQENARISVDLNNKEVLHVNNDSSNGMKEQRLKNTQQVLQKGFSFQMRESVRGIQTSADHPIKIECEDINEEDLMPEQHRVGMFESARFNSPHQAPPPSGDFQNSTHSRLPQSNGCISQPNTYSNESIFSEKGKQQSIPLYAKNQRNYKETQSMKSFNDSQSGSGAGSGGGGAGVEKMGLKSIPSLANLSDNHSLNDAEQYSQSMKKKERKKLEEQGDQQEKESGGVSKSSRNFHKANLNRKNQVEKEICTHHACIKEGHCAHGLKLREKSSHFFKSKDRCDRINPDIAKVQHLSKSGCVQSFRTNFDIITNSNQK